MYTSRRDSPSIGTLVAVVPELTPSNELKVKLQRELNNTRIYACARDLAERRVAIIRIWVRELSVVEGVKKFCSKFKIGIFPGPAHRKFLQNRQVPVVLSGPFERADGGISEPKGIGIIPTENRRECEAIGINVVIEMAQNIP